MSPLTTLRPTTDGVVTIRPLEPGDAKVLVAGRDAVFHRFLGPGENDPQPAGCIVVGTEIVGWVDYDDYRAWRLPGEVNLGYNVFAAHRGRGCASRAVQLLMHHLAISGEYDTATLLIHPENERSLALATRTRFVPHGDLDGNPYFKRSVPPLAYGDGTVTIRRRRVEDLAADLESKDDEQIDRLWLPGQREAWEAMSAGEQRAHALRHLQANHDDFGSGPKWTFSVDAGDAECVAYVDCDLANDQLPAGEANISYASHPAQRGRGYASRAVRLVLRFLRDHTGARRAHLVIDEKNGASLGAATAVGAQPRDARVDERGRTLTHHTIEL